jgi:oleandomycin transport system ATP-binding protein
MPAEKGAYATVIKIQGITKRFGDRRALRGVDVDVPAGSVHGLLGPNGAGKTTLVRILATLERPDSGWATVAGYDVVREARMVRQRIALTGQAPAVDDDISGRENLYMIARLLDQPRRQARARADEMLERFGLSSVATKTTRGYSGGMRRRLDLAISLVGDPQVLYLDEPTTGLDPHSRRSTWEIIRAMADQGVTILLTTQHMEEAEALADAVTVLHHGRIIATGTPGELRARMGGQILHIQPASAADRPAVARALAAAGLDPSPLARLGPSEDDNMVKLPITREWELTHALKVLAATGLGIATIDTRVPSLDEVFLSLTGSSRADATPGWRTL